MLAESNIAAALEELDLAGAQVELHASLRSFGWVNGGAETVVSALKRELKTLLVPAFCSEACAPTPTHEHVERNAWTNEDYFFNNPPPPKPFDPLTSPVDKDMGVIAQTIAKQPGSCRSTHPLCSWAAWGEDADYLTANHSWDDAFLPIKRLMERNGSILLIGTSLTSCTAIHLAEEVTGRRMFIRWALDLNGQVRRARCGGCSDGFDRLFPQLEDVFRKTQVGACRMLAVPLSELVERAATVIRSDPSITMCERKCDRCLAAFAGGPVE